ncbi:carbohydrate kinase family protein [Sphingobacterium sp. HJSM2_6]|uniref:carbohydrate kinase family protein n=1 Tax=Sphingobacterium sp. HJSM2_6 TaxID=3366264 RepID=UPI003BE1F68B
MSEKKELQVACFGEVLWDLFPGQEKKAGGAPFNVAYHLSRLGVDARMISAVGNDDLGQELLNQLKNWNLPLENLQILLNQPTSTVLATLDENNDAHYEIVAPVAWDFIEFDRQAKELMEASDALVFGSLATRNKESRDTLFSLLEYDKLHVFDINIRQPFFHLPTIEELLKRTHIAKFNKAELLLLLDSLAKNLPTDEDRIAYLQDRYRIEEIIVSNGAIGACYATAQGIQYFPAKHVNVADTVGSGDAFLAGFLSKRLAGEKNESLIMNEAISLGAFITAHHGACPSYTMEEFEDFKRQL